MIPPDIIEPVKVSHNYYTVEKYDDLCEPHFRIKKIVALRKPSFKFCLDVILNIITLGLINYLYGFSTYIVKFMRYSECPLEEGKILGIYCTDGYFYFTELKRELLPVIDNPDVFLTEANSRFMGAVLFTFKLFTYIYNPKTNSFSSIKFNIYHTKEEIYNLMSYGLTENERRYQKQIYGECDLNFHIDSFFKALFKNSCTFFFAFQIYAMILWYCTEYEAYASLILVLTVIDLFEHTITNLSNLKSIRRIARYNIPIKIHRKTRDNEIEIIEDESCNLVPGDVFELPDNGMSLPCDCILLSGSVVINEAMLTGESTPLIKNRLPEINQNFDEEKDAKYFLFSGTKIVQKRSEKKKPNIALVYSIGFNTVKGNLIRSVLYPVKVESRFEKESAKFIFFMALLCIIGYLGILPKRISREDTPKDIVLKFLDLITTAVPPSLPCCLGIGIGIAQRRIKKKGIMCINRDKITPAGKVNICVFDKTGTLTEDHLNISGFLPVQAHSNEDSEDPHSVFTFDKHYDSVKDLSQENYEYYKQKMKGENVKSRKKELRQLYLECLACCQGITKVDNKYIGDPIDVEMFESTGWDLIEDCEDINNYEPKIATYVRPKEEKSLTEKLDGLPGFNGDPNNEEIKKRIYDHYEIGIVRRFDFSSKFQRMSTLVKNLTQPNFICYCKGSPEKLKELCQPKTIPANFIEQLNYYTSRGYRVLAMASKIINMDLKSALEISRSYCEKDMIFLGLLIVQNKLKLATNPTLKILSEDAQIRVRMATGDNILTAVCVGRKSNLIGADSVVYSCEIEEEKDELEDGIINERKSMGILANTQNLEKEKERRKKKLVWKTIESFQEDDIKNEGDNKIKSSITRETIINTNLDTSFMAPQNITPDDCKIENEGSQMLKINPQEKKEEKIDIIEEDDLFEVDLSVLPFKEEDEREIELAITGKTFEALYRLNKKYEEYDKRNKLNYQENFIEQNKQKLIDVDNLINEEENKSIQYKQFHDAFRLVLKYCSVYARCSPENKSQIVQSLQNEKFTVLMCGDGANDCAALKVADVGISLSKEEASIAAPFTSNCPDISCVIELLKEGKCALVTSLQIFKYILSYSLIQFISVNLLIVIGSYLSDWQYMASDLFLITPLAFLMPLAPCAPKLTYHKPVSSLFSFSIIFSLGVQTICIFIFQIVAHYITRNTFPDPPFGYFLECNAGETEFNYTILNVTKPEPMPWEEEEDTYYMECIYNSSNFYISFAQYLILAVVFCTGKPFKKNIFYNYGMLIFSIIGLLYAEYIVFFVDGFSRNTLKITPYPDDKISYFYGRITPDMKTEHNYQFKFIIMLLIIINFLVCLFFEKVVVFHCSKFWRRHRMENNRKKLEADVNKEATLYLINDVKNYVEESKISKNKILE